MLAAAVLLTSTLLRDTDRDLPNISWSCSKIVKLSHKLGYFVINSTQFPIAKQRFCNGTRTLFTIP